ncbi:hypothetical protein ABPG77_008460 [Micractinium sp. CCAP 211/92]
MSPAASSNNLQQERRTHSLQAGSLAGAVANAAAATVEPQAVFNIRRYRPSDLPQVVEICRNVYGGTDVLPDRITGEAARPDTNVLVAAASADDTVAALLCCQQRGDVLWLYGARTREDMRRRGLAELLLAEAEALARTLPGVTALLSVTVPVNGTMRGIFARRSLRQLCHVVSWPPYTVARELHSQLTEAPPAGEERQRPASLLDALPGAAAVLQNDQARQLLPLWRRCQTQAELEVALLQLRQRRMDAVVAAARPAAPAGEQQAHATSQQQSNAFHWVPEEFELLPASSAQAAELVSQGQVWLLPAGVATAGSQVAATQPQDHQQQQPGAQHDLPAVLVLHGPGVWGMRHAGIVAASRAALDSAVLLTTRLEPRCCCFYVDRCERFDHDILWASTAGDRVDVLPHWKQL